MSNHNNGTWKYGLVQLVLLKIVERAKRIDEEKRTKRTRKQFEFWLWVYYKAPWIGSRYTF